MIDANVEATIAHYDDDAPRAEAAARSLVGYYEARGRHAEAQVQADLANAIHATYATGDLFTDIMAQAQGADRHAEAAEAYCKEQGYLK